MKSEITIIKEDGWIIVIKGTKTEATLEVVKKPN